MDQQSNDEVLNRLPVVSPLTGRTAIVTGSSRGIGEATTRVLASVGAELVVTGNTAERAQRNREPRRPGGRPCARLPVDLTGPPSEIQAFAAAVYGVTLDALPPPGWPS